MAYLAGRSSERTTVHGKRLWDGLQTLAWRPSVGAVRGNGMSAGIGLVDDKGTRKPALGRAPRVVADAGKRHLLYDMDMALLQLRQDAGETQAVVQLTGTYHNLLRRWAQT